MKVEIVLIILVILTFLYIPASPLNETEADAIWRTMGINGTDVEVLQPNQTKAKPDFSINKLFDPDAPENQLNTTVLKWEHPSYNSTDDTRTLAPLHPLTPSPSQAGSWVEAMRNFLRNCRDLMDKGKELAETVRQFGVLGDALLLLIVLATISTILKLLNRCGLIPSRTTIKEWVLGLCSCCCFWKPRSLPRLPSTISLDSAVSEKTLYGPASGENRV